MDAEIRRVYQTRERGGNKRLARKFGVPPGLVSARAARLGLTSLIVSGARAVSHAFRPEEMALIRAHLGEPIAQIRARLYRKGYARSLSSITSLIASQRNSGAWPTLAEQLDDRDALRIPDVLAGLGVNSWTVETWIKRGLLKVRRVTGNDVIVLTRRDLRAFLLRYPAHWDHRPADRWFLLDILCGDAAAAASAKAANVA